MIYNYERLLRQVTYTNRKPAYYLNRQFKIVCSEMNRRFISNEYSQMVSTKDLGCYTYEYSCNECTSTYTLKKVFEKIPDITPQYNYLLSYAIRPFCIFLLARIKLSIGS